MRDALEMMGPKIAIILDEKAKKSPGGIVIPDTSTRPTTSGKVVFVGPDVTGVELRNRRVWVTPGCGHYVEAAGVKYLIVSHEDVLCVESL